MGEMQGSDSEDFLSDESSEEEVAASSSSKKAKTSSPAKKSKDKEPETDPDDEKTEGDEKKQKRTSWFQRKKRGLASAAASSSMGKAMFNKFVDRETKNLLKAIIKVVELQDGKKKAAKVRKDIMKTAVKVIVLYEEQKVTDEDFQSMQYLFRRACAGVRNAYQGRTMKNVDQDSIAERIGGHLTQFSSGVVKVIKPFVSRHSIDRIEALLGYLANPKFLSNSFKLDEFQTIAMVLSSYLQNTQKGPL